MLNKKSNAYADQISAALYEATPKAVFAAIAVSPIQNNGAVSWGGESENSYIASEWNTLHENGIVPQPVPAKFRYLIRS